MNKLYEKLFKIIKNNQNQEDYSYLKKEINLYLDNNDYDFKCTLIKMRTSCFIISFDNGEQLSLQLS